MPTLKVRDNDNLAWVTATGPQGPQGLPGSGAIAAWPVGSVFLAIVGTSPATLLGFGTWAAIATGRCLVGYQSGDADFGALQGTGGAKTKNLAHTHAITNTDAANATSESSHTHSVTVSGTSGAVSVTHTHIYIEADDGEGAEVNTGTQSVGHTHTFSKTVTSAAGSSHHHHYTAPPEITDSGGSATQDVLPPYYVLYAWKRTA